MSGKNFEGNIEVIFQPENRHVRVCSGATVFDAALIAGIVLDSPCGGEGRCGKCVVRVKGGVFPPTTIEIKSLGKEKLSRGFRLACQTLINNKCTILLPETSPMEDRKSGILSREQKKVSLPGKVLNLSNKPAGAALDIGTTTLSISILDLKDGKRLAAVSAFNPQRQYGADVMTRISKCIEEKETVKTMQRMVIEALNGCLEQACALGGLETSSIVRLVAVGNTAMLSLALGINPAPLGRAPFTPPFKGPLSIRACEIGLLANEQALLHVPRIISGFLGADITAGMLWTRIHCGEKTSALVDLGTNGEIAFGKNERIVACSTAAGPAFEGSQISCGMRAAPGAIEYFKRDSNLTPHVLGGGIPKGICGSGLLDACALLLDLNLLTPRGRLVSPSEGGELAKKRIKPHDSSRAFVLYPGHDLYLTQKDIREVQLAKSAIASGFKVLSALFLEENETLEKIWIAGAFGNFLKSESVVRIGMIPPRYRDRMKMAGNAALLGAEMMLASSDAFDEAGEIARKTVAIELSGNPLFEKEFYENLDFPQPD